MVRRALSTGYPSTVTLTDPVPHVYVERWSQMSGDDDDTDPARFVQMGHLPPLSREAFQLHSFGALSAYKDGYPSFVSDEYLNAVAAETTSTAAELCVNGLWERVDGGYRIHDDEMLAMIGESHLHMG